MCSSSALSLTLAYMIGISGSQLRQQLCWSNAQIVCAGIPMTLALLLSSAAPTTPSLPSCWCLSLRALKLISDRLRRVLLDAVVAGRDVSLLAGRFDTALNNMPHGLCMFDAERRVAVCNKRLAALLGLAPDIAGQRQTALDSSRNASVPEPWPPPTPDVCWPSSRAALSARGNGEVVLETEQGRTLAITFHPMADGGAVVLFEDIADRRVAKAKIDQLARYDALTGLPNRALFRDRWTLPWSACAAAGRSPSTSSTSTSSSRSTIRWAIPAATSSCAWPPTACARRARLRHRRPLRRRRVGAAVPWVTPMKLRPWPSKSWMCSAGAFQIKRPPDCGRRQHRHSLGTARWRWRRPAF